MFVDDEPDILSVIAKGLRKAGFAVHSFDNPLRALRHIEVDGCKECKIVVSDIKMPELSGFQLVRKLKGLRPDMKVILVTAFEVNKPEFESLFPSTPIDFLMQKPFAASQLVEVLHMYCNPA